MSLEVLTRSPVLRPYQLAALDGIERQLDVLGHRSTLVVQATGTGKTVVFSERTRRVRSRGPSYRVLILVERDELLRQARRKLEDVGIEPDIEKGKLRASLLARVVLASVQSMRGPRLLRFRPDHFAEIIVDEAHHSTARTYRAIIDHFSTAKVLGVTATPDRGDGAALGEIFVSVAARYEMRAAIRDGYLVPIVARRVVIDEIDLSSIGTSRDGDFQQDKLAAVMNAEGAVIGVVDSLIDLVGDRRTIVFGVDVAHAKSLANRINAIRPGSARWVNGDLDEDERVELIEAFAAGEYQFLCNCQLLVEGFDCPEVECIAIAKPTKSRAAFVQMAGRGSRLSPATGKKNMLLIGYAASSVGRHRLVGPIDCLAGSGDADPFAAELRAELDILLGAGERDLEGAIVEVEAELNRRRLEEEAKALVAFHVEDVDPFIGWGPPRTADHELMFLPGMEPWQDNRPTPDQMKALEDLGVLVSKLPRAFTTEDAAKLLTRLRRRSSDGLCSLAIARKLHAAGLDPREITMSRGLELIRMLAGYNWRPMILWQTPEAQTATAKIRIAEIARRLAEKRAEKTRSDANLENS